MIHYLAPYAVYLISFFILGATLENVVALEGYFIGLDSGGTSFVECFNAACGNDGKCIYPYTGQFCAACSSTDSTPALVLNAKFECEVCPATWVVACAMTLVLLVLFGLVIRKSQKNKRGLAPSRTSVFFKIVVSAFRYHQSYLPHIDKIQETRYTIHER